MAKRASTDLLIPEFYKRLSEEECREYSPGHLCFTHVVYPQSYPRILKPEKIHPKDETESTFLIKPYSSGDEKHYPIKILNLKADEMFYIYTGKMRPVVILGYVESEWFEGKQNVLLCAPVFSFKDRHSQEFIVKTQAFVYPSLFYLPVNHKGCYAESAVRFELIQPIMDGYIQPYRNKIDNKPISLTNDAYWYLINHLLKFICGKPIDEKLDEYVNIYRELLLESLENEN
jgi:hypothetical protein